MIFEEAAGISRLKSRKTDAERRLERVEQNLLRLTDIVDEVDSQVNALRSQAQRASAFREVSTELQGLWIGMVCDDYRRQSKVRSDLIARRDASAATLAEIRERRQEAEELSLEAEAALSTLDEEIHTVEANRSDVRSKIASMETTLQHQTSREAELHDELRRLQRQVTMMDGRVAEAEQEHRRLKTVLQREQDRLSESRQQQLQSDHQLTDLRNTLETTQHDIELTRSRLMNQMQHNSELGSRIGALQSERDNQQKRLAELESSRQEQRSVCEQLDGQLVEHTKGLDDACEHLKHTEEAASRMLESRNAITAEQASSRESLAELREQRSAAEARRSVLEDLEERQEGFGIGVREILSRAEQSDESPWNLIRGSVADLLDVEMKHAAMLEVALSGRAQLLVIDRLAPLVSYLNTGRCRMNGRVGFVSLESAPPQIAHAAPQPPATQIESTDETDPLRLPTIDTEWLLNDQSGSLTNEFSPELSVTWVDGNDTPVHQSVFSQTASPSLTGQPGVIGRADSLARSPVSMPHLSALLLADTWVVATLVDAVRIVDESGGSVRAITPQGELVERDGTLHAGMVRSETAVVSRKSELRRLRNELHRVAHHISERELGLKRLIDALASADTELQSSRQDVTEATALARTTEQRVAETQQARMFAQQRIDVTEHQIKAVTEELESLESRQQTAFEESTAGEADLIALQQMIRSAEIRLTTDQQMLESLDAGRTESSVELSRLEERVLSLNESDQRLKDDIEQRCLQQIEADRRFQAGNVRVRKLGLAALNVQSTLAEQHVVDDRLTNQITERQRSRAVLKARRTEASQAESDARTICREHETQFHELELQIRGIDHQLTTSTDRIQDEFQVDVGDAVQEGHSAVALWLTQQRKSNSDDDAAVALPDVKSLTGESDDVAGILDDDEQYVELRRTIELRVDRLRRKLKKIGNVNTDSLDDLTELETRVNRLHSQLRDLEAARDALRDMVRKINVESRRMFLESFECVRGHFRELFRRLFGGGEADLVLEDPEDVLDCSIDVVARPPGKELRSLSLLSGGEKTLTAVALLLSIFRSRPSPFCLLDEVDAALDDANIARFVGVLKEFRDETQFIMITHRKPTMAVTDVLYGVTMEESGVSKRLSVRFEEIDENGNFVPSSQTRRAA